MVDNGVPQEYVYYPLTPQGQKGSKPDFGVFVPQLFYFSFYQLIYNTIKTKDVKVLDTELENWVIQESSLQSTNQPIDPFTTRLRHVRDETAVIFLGNRLAVMHANAKSKAGDSLLKEKEDSAKKLFAKEIFNGFQKESKPKTFLIEVEGETISYHFHPLHRDPLKIKKQPLSGFGFLPSDDIVIKTTSGFSFSPFDEIVTTEDDELGVFIPSEIYKGAFLDCFRDHTCLLKELTENWDIYEKLSTDLKRIHLSAQHKKRKDLVLFLCPLKNIFIK